MKKKIAINGFGRIGRAVFKIALENENLEVVAINDLTDAKTLAHLLKYDTAYGIYGKEVSYEENALIVDGISYALFSEPHPKELPWEEYAVDTVLECTGRFVVGRTSEAHMEAGARRVLLSAPAKGDGGVATVIRGINCESIQEETLVSNASCTTNCIAPVSAILEEAYGIDKAMMTTIHSYTADQRLQDAPHKDLRRARAAAANIVPTTTGAAIAATQVIPELEGKFDGLAVRVPTITVSLSDITFVLKKDVTVEELNTLFTEMSTSDRYKGILGVTNEPLVSSDFIGDSRSAIVDLSLTKVVGGNLVKIIAWYDNEWGYSNRLVELAVK